jgi:hypothetical protein
MRGKIACGVMLWVFASGAWAQRPGGGRPGPAHQAPPSHGPPPVRVNAPPAREAPGREAHGQPTQVRTAPAPREQPRYFGEAKAPATRQERPRVEANEHWVGHESGPDDRRYHLVHPFHAGRFTGEMGATHLYRIGGWDGGRHRFWFNGFAWGVAAWDWDYVDDWDWANDQVVIYDDPDHEGWYLAYNERLGTYVHVQYDGPQG